jgi:hypothetical protein
MKQDDLERRDTNGNGSHAARPERRRDGGLALDALLANPERGALDELYRFWDGGSGAVPEDAELLRTRLRAWMRDPVRVEERATRLPRRLSTVLEDLIGAPRFQKSWSELARSRALAYLSPYDLEASLAALARRGFVGEGDDRRFERFGGERIVGVPHELAESLLARRRERQSGLYGTLTLRGHLDQVYADSGETARISPQRLRELYKMYSQESAAIARIERLPEGMRKLVEKAILEFGGILPRQLFERMETDLPHWNGRRWRLILEQSLVGTVRELDLTHYGVQLQDDPRRRRTGTPRDTEPTRRGCRPRR